MAFRTALFTLAAAAAVATASQQKRRCHSSCTELESLTAAEPRESELTRCMAVIDASRDAWEVERSNLASFEENCRSGVPTIEVMRQPKVYPCTYDGKTAPVLRILAFLPHVNTEAAYDQVTDVHKRPLWDTDYCMFEAAPQADDLQPRAPNILLHVQRPWKDVVTQTRTDANAPLHDFTCVRFESRWFVHCLASGFLSKLGVPKTFFAYQRDSFAYRTNPSAGSIVAYDILYSGAPDMVSAVSTIDPHVTAFLDAKRAAARRVAPVVNNYQHIALIPITSVQRQLIQDDQRGWQRLCQTGSLVDRASASVLRDFLTESSTLAAANQPAQDKDCSGTIYLLTSVNCANVPPGTPMWLQRKVTDDVAVDTCKNLQKACIT